MTQIQSPIPQPHPDAVDPFRFIVRYQLCGDKRETHPMSYRKAFFMAKGWAMDGDAMQIQLIDTLTGRVVESFKMAVTQPESSRVGPDYGLIAGHERESGLPDVEA